MVVVVMIGFPLRANGGLAGHFFGSLGPLSEPLLGLCNEEQALLGFGVGHCLGRRRMFLRRAFANSQHLSAWVPPLLRL